MTTTTTAPQQESSVANTDASQPLQMRAVTQDRYGDSSVLELTTTDRPAISADEVLIEVRAAAIDRGTEHLMTGLPWLIRVVGYGFRRPKQPVPGLDVSGVVSAVGGDVTRFTVGDEVFGIADGSLAEFTKAKEVKLSLKPASITFEQAAASAISGITALQALTDVGNIEAGQRVLVVGASGGVGTFAVQLAKALGARVDGVAGRRNIELVRSLGADTVYDHRTTDLADIGERYDLVIDIGGRNSVRTLRQLLATRGSVVFVGGEDGNRLTGGIGRQIRAAALSPFVGHQLKMFMSTEHHRFIDRLAEHLDNGSITPHIGRQFPLDQAIDAMQLLESGGASGKTVISVSGSPS